MKYLQASMGFQIELPIASILITVKGYKLIKGIIPSTYGDIMNDIPLSSNVTLDSLSFYDVFEELMTKSKFFMKDKLLASKNIFFLRKCGVYGTYHWVHMIEWNDEGYAIGENPNVNFFIEPWRNHFARKHLLEDSIFFVLQSRKELSSVITCSDCGEILTTQEICSKIMHIAKDDGSLNCQEGKAYCEKCKQKSYTAGTFVGDW